MFKRPTTGSIVCSSCGRLVGVRDEKCLGCGRTHPGLWGFAPLVNQFGRNLGFSEVILTGCVALFIIALLKDPSQLMSGGLLSILSPSSEALLMLGASGAQPVFGFGRWWTVLSAAWLHGGLLHIFMNMMWIRQLVPPLTEFYGVGRLVIIYTVSSITGFALTSVMFFFPLGPLQGSLMTVGASAPLFGLFGALVLYGQVTGSRMMTQQVWRWVIIFVVIGLLIPFVDNWAHLGGFAGGWLAARFLDPRKSESPQHLVAGLVCLGLTLLSIIASVVHGVSLLSPRGF